MFNHPGRRGLKVVVMMSCPTRLTAVLMLASFPGVGVVVESVDHSDSF